MRRFWKGQVKGYTLIISAIPWKAQKENYRLMKMVKNAFFHIPFISADG